MVEIKTWVEEKWWWKHESFFFFFRHFNQVHQGRKWEKDETFSPQRSSINFFFSLHKTCQKRKHQKTCQFHFMPATKGLNFRAKNIIFLSLKMNLNFAPFFKLYWKKTLNFHAKINSFLSGQFCISRLFFVENETFWITKLCRCVKLTTRRRFRFTLVDSWQSGERRGAWRLFAKET